MADEPRLRAEDSDLGEALRDAKNVGPSDTDRAAMVAGLAGIFGPPPTGGLPSSGSEAATGASGASGSVAASALVKWAAAACLVGGAVWWGAPDVLAPDVVADVAVPAEVEVAPEAAPEAAEATPTNPRIDVLPVTAALALPPHTEFLGPPPALPVEEATAPAPQSTRSPLRQRAPQAAAAAMPSPQPTGASASSEEPQPAIEPAPERPSELALLAQARRVLRSSPAQTLRLTTEHQEHFGAGALVEEREVLAIEALVRLGRHSQATSRSERFARRYPRSIHAGRIAAVLAP